MDNEKQKVMMQKVAEALSEAGCIGFSLTVVAMQGEQVGTWSSASLPLPNTEMSLEDGHGAIMRLAAKVMEDSDRLMAKHVTERMRDFSEAKAKAADAAAKKAAESAAESAETALN